MMNVVFAIAMTSLMLDVLIVLGKIRLNDNRIGIDKPLNILCCLVAVTNGLSDVLTKVLFIIMLLVCLKYTLKIVRVS